MYESYDQSSTADATLTPRKESGNLVTPQTTRWMQIASQGWWRHGPTLWISVRVVGTRRLTCAKSSRKHLNGYWCLDIALTIPNLTKSQTSRLWVVRLSRETRTHSSHLESLLSPSKLTFLQVLSGRYLLTNSRPRRRRQRHCFLQALCYMNFLLVLICYIHGHTHLYNADFAES